MSNVTLNLGSIANAPNQQASAADDEPGSGAAGQVAAIMKKIAKLQKDSAGLQGPPDEVAKMRKAIEAEIRTLELKMQQIMEQQARDQQRAQSAATTDAPGRAGPQKTHASRKRPGNLIDEVV